MCSPLFVVASFRSLSVFDHPTTVGDIESLDRDQLTAWVNFEKMSSSASKTLSLYCDVPLVVFPPFLTPSIDFPRFPLDRVSKLDCPKIRLRANTKNCCFRNISSRAFRGRPGLFLHPLVVEKPSFESRSTVRGMPSLRLLREWLKRIHHRQTRPYGKGRTLKRGSYTVRLRGLLFASAPTKQPDGRLPKPKICRNLVRGSRQHRVRFPGTELAKIPEGRLPSVRRLKQIHGRQQRENIRISSRHVSLPQRREGELPWSRECYGRVRGSWSPGESRTRTPVDSAEPM